MSTPAQNHRSTFWIELFECIPRARLGERKTILFISLVDLLESHLTQFFSVIDCNFWPYGAFVGLLSTRPLLLTSDSRFALSDDCTAANSDCRRGKRLICDGAALLASSDVCRRRSLVGLGTFSSDQSSLTLWWRSRPFILEPGISCVAYGELETFLAYESVWTRMHLHSD